MTTTEMQAMVAKAGHSMKRQQFAGQNAIGKIVARHRWEVHEVNTGDFICMGRNPRTCFKVWKKKQKEQTT